MTYSYKRGDSNAVIFLLHGTGGDENDLLELGRIIDSKATLIGIRGRVQEQGMNRYFKRLSQGNFDEKSLNEESKWLYETIEFLINKHALSYENVSVLGYSNGANIMQSILKMYRTNYSKIMLLHPSPVRQNVAFIHQDLSLFVSGGSNDPYASKEDYEKIIEDAKKASMRVSEYLGPYGHSITEKEVEAIRNFYQKGARQ